MAQLGGGKINPHPCTPEDAIANWQIQNQINENITLQDTFKVKVSGTDGAEGYLAETIANAADTFSSDEDLPIAKEIQASGGDESLLVYVDSSAIPSYNTSGTYAICMVDGVTQWFDTSSFGGSGSDDKTVKVSSADTTSSYLHDAIKDQASYTTTADLLIYAAITDASANEHLRLFIDSSSITGDAGSGTILLGKVGGGWQFIDASDVVDDLTLVRLTLAGSTLTADQQFQMLRGQCTGNVLAGDATFSVDHIELLSDCKDPRSVHGSTSETLTIHKEDVKTGLRNDDWIVAVRSDTDSQWELLCTERYRSIRGTWYSGLSTLTIDNITVLGNGLDPRTVTTSTAETVSVSNPSNSVFVADDTVYADWNSRLGVWEARPKIIASIDQNIVLIDKSLLDIHSAQPEVHMSEAGILTADEITAGWSVVWQDPADDNYTLNNVSYLNLWKYRRNKAALKYFTSDPIEHSGTVVSDGGGTDTIELEHTASTITDFYKGSTITTTGGTGSGQTKTITAYNGTTFVATVDSDWSTAPAYDTTYEITSDLYSKLATVTADDTENKKRIVRFDLMTVYYDDPLEVGDYGREDYPGYPENEVFPPDGTGTYQECPTGFLTKKYRGVVIGGVLNTAFCTLLPPPDLIPV